MKQNIKRLLPVSIVIGITIIVSIFLYHKVMDREEERCWQILSDSAKTISAEIQMKLQDNITTLGLAANAMVQENKLEPEQIASVHLDAFAKNTIFSRIDVLYPDNTILYEDGHLKHLRQDLDFNAIAALGEHISHRLTDSEKRRKTRKHGLQKRAHTRTYVTDFAARVDDGSRNFYFVRSVSEDFCGCGVCR